MQILESYDGKAIMPIFSVDKNAQYVPSTMIGLCGIQHILLQHTRPCDSLNIMQSKLYNCFFSRLVPLILVFKDVFWLCLVRERSFSFAQNVCTVKYKFSTCAPTAVCKNCSWPFHSTYAFRIYMQCRELEFLSLQLSSTIFILKAERCNPIHEVRRQFLVKVHEYNFHGHLQTIQFNLHYTKHLI